MDLPDPKTLKNFVKFLRKEGISHIKSGDFEMSLAPGALFPVKPGKGDTNDRIDTEEMSEEAALYWSSAGIAEGGQ